VDVLRHDQSSLADFIVSLGSELVLNSSHVAVSYLLFLLTKNRNGSRSMIRGVARRWLRPGGTRLQKVNLLKHLQYLKIPKSGFDSIQINGRLAHLPLRLFGIRP